MGSAQDYHIAAEPDVSGRLNKKIWLYFITFGLLLALTFIGLTIMYQFAVDEEKTVKIGHIDTPEAREQKVEVANYLSGKVGLFEGKQHVAIDVAMSKFLENVRKAHD